MTSPTANNPVENAWKIHAALVDWTGKVDGKASFVLGLESAIFAALVYLRSDDHLLSVLNNGTASLGFAVGGVLIVVSMLLALWAVTPILYIKNARANWQSNYIFFGHLHNWKPADLEVALKDDPVLPVLARQLVIMSKAAWSKHLRVQWSVLAGLLGSVGLVVSILSN